MADTRQCAYCGGVAIMVRPETYPRRDPTTGEHTVTVEYYRCHDCPEGGEIVTDERGDLVTKRGPVVDSRTEVPADKHLAADGGSRAGRHAEPTDGRHP